MVGVAYKMVLVREIEIPKDAMEKFGAIVGVEEIPVGGIDINCEAGVANLPCIGAGQVSGIVRLPKQRVTRGTY